MSLCHKPTRCRKCGCLVIVWKRNGVRASLLRQLALADHDQVFAHQIEKADLGLKFGAARADRVAMEHKTSQVILANNTNADLRDFDAALIAHVRHDEPLPEEIADLIEVTIYEAEDGRRGIINWA